MKAVAATLLLFLLAAKAWANPSEWFQLPAMDTVKLGWDNPTASVWVVYPQESDASMMVTPRDWARFKQLYAKGKKITYAGPKKSLGTIPARVPGYSYVKGKKVPHSTPVTLRWMLPGEPDPGAPVLALRFEGRSWSRYVEFRAQDFSRIEQAFAGVDAAMGLKPSFPQASGPGPSPVTLQSGSSAGKAWEGQNLIHKGTLLLLHASEEKRAGRTASVRRCYLEAVDKFNEGLQLYPHQDRIRAQALCGRGKAYENLGRYGQAAADYKAVVAECDPRWIHWATARKCLADLRAQRRIP